MKKWCAWSFVPLVLALAAPGAAVPLVESVEIGTPASGKALDDSVLGADKQLHVVVDSPYEIFDGTSTLIHVAAWRNNFAPAGRALVYLDDTLVGRTDHRGVFVASVPLPKNAKGRRSVVVVHGTGAGLQAGEVAFEAYNRTEGFASDRLHVYTDRRVYAPGQKIHIRALAWHLEQSFSPIVDEKLEFHLLDDGNRLVAGTTVTTDDFGAASESISLARSMPEGRYKLAVLYNGERHETRLRIERVRVPTVDIQHTLPRFVPRTRTHGPLDFDVTVSALSTGVPTRGVVRARLVDGRGGRKLWHKARDLKGAGTYRFSIDADVLDVLIDSTSDGATARVELTVEGADGSESGVQREMVLTDHPITTTVETDKTEYTRGETARVVVKISDLDGVPVRNKLVRLVDEDGKLATKARTDRHGVAVLRLELTREENFLDVFVEGLTQPIDTVDLYTVADKALVSKIDVPRVREGGSVPIVVRFRPGYVPVENFLHADVVDTSGALVDVQLLPIGRQAGGYVARGRITAPQWGSMLITMFCVGRGPQPARNGFRTGPGLLTEGQQLTVHPGRELTVTFGGLPDEARPGATVEPTIRVVDERGRSVDASVGLSVVDAAAIAQGDPLEVTPMDRFYNPELKTLSTTGAKLLTWPVVSRNWGPTQEDVALPPFGFLEGEERPTRSPTRRLAKKANTPKIKLGGTTYGSSYSYGSGGSLGALGAGEVGSGSFALKKTSPSKIVLAEIKVEGKVAKPDTSAIGTKAKPRRKRQKTVVVWRKRFPETSAWLPNLRATRGVATASLTLPDTMTHQVVTAVASDARGGVGMTRATVSVAAPLSAKLDLPSHLVAGRPGKVSVWLSATTSRERVEVELRGDGLAVEGPHKQVIAVESGRPTKVDFTVVAAQPGAVEIASVARAGRSHDAARRTLEVRPAGKPVAKRTRHTLSAETPLKLTIESDGNSEAAIGVFFEGSEPALDALDAVAKPTGVWLESPGSAAVMARYLLRYLARRGALTPERRVRLIDVIERQLMLTAALTHHGGGTVFWRSGKPSPYLTARALEALIAAREVDLVVPHQLFLSTSSALLDGVGQDGLITVDDIGWWEGDDRARRTALTAEAFRVLAEVGPGSVSAHRRQHVVAMAAFARKTVESSSDPLALANAGVGLLHYERRWLHRELDDGTRQLLLARLTELRRRNTFEPSWFHGDGGRTVTTAAAIELASELDPAVAATWRRSAMQDLARSRPLVGKWHHDAASIALLRAMASIAPGPRGVAGGTVEVRVDGRTIVRQVVDPRDPFAATLALARVDLSDAVRPAGRHEVTVRYEGGHVPAVSLTVTRFLGEAGPPNTRRP